VFAFVVWRYRRRASFLRSIEMSRITVDDLYRLIEDGREPVVIDVRSDAGVQMDARQIPGALTIHLAELRARAGELPRDREIVLYCDCPNEASAASAARILAAHGFTRVRPLLGGLEAWVAAGRDTVLASTK
jgi:rhodanese-related sulfurtransferase